MNLKTFILILWGGVVGLTYLLVLGNAKQDKNAGSSPARPLCFSWALTSNGCAVGGLS